MDLKQALARGEREQNTLKWIKAPMVNASAPGLIQVRKAKRGWTYCVKVLRDGELVPVKWGTCKTVERARMRGEAMRNYLIDQH